MKKYVKRIFCGIIATIMMFALVSCGGNDLEDVIIGTWEISWNGSVNPSFRNDGSISVNEYKWLYDSYDINGNILRIYTEPGTTPPNHDIGNYRDYEVEILSNDSLKLYEINDDGTKDDKVKYMDRISE